MISKNLYSLQNAQPFIFQLICMQLYKYLNCFLKTHKKQLNQYCLNFFFFTKKKFLKKWFRFGSGRVELSLKKHGSGHRLTRFVSDKKKKIEFGSNIFRARSENFNPFCHVYFRVLNLLFREFFTQLYRGLFINKAHKAQCQKLTNFRLS